MSKYKVGDLVRFTHISKNHGRTGVIDRIRTDGDYQVRPTKTLLSTNGLEAGPDETLHITDNGFIELVPTSRIISEESNVVHVVFGKRA